MSDSGEEKTLPASEKKIRQAREKGQIPHSKEMVTAVVTVACFGYLMLRAPAFTTYLEEGLSSLPEAYDAPFGDAAKAMVTRLGVDALAAVGPLLALVAMSAVVTNLVVNGGLVVSLHPISPDPNKLNPVQGLKRMFNLKGLLELVKSLLKLAVAGYLVFGLIEGALQALVEIPACGLACGVAALGALLKRMLLIMSGLFLALGALDIGLQRWMFMRDQRMSLTEQKRERKDSDGDPEIKRQHQHERRADGFKTGLRNATFAIRSPTTVLAMRYTPSDAPVPVLVARGTGEGLDDILGQLQAMGIPIVNDAAAVAALAPGLKIGRMITKDMFEPVISCMQEAGIL